MAKSVGTRYGGAPKGDPGHAKAHHPARPTMPAKKAVQAANYGQGKATKRGPIKTGKSRQ